MTWLYSLPALRSGLHGALLACGALTMAACSSLSSFWPFGSSTPPAPEPEPATISWLVPSETMIAFTMSSGIDIENKQAVLEIKLSPPANSQAAGGVVLIETFKLIRKPKRELANLGDAADTPGMAYFRFDTDDYERVQAMIDRKNQSAQEGAPLVDGFALIPSFCRRGTPADPALFTSSILFSNARDANGLPRTRTIVSDGTIRNAADIKRCR